MLRSLAGILLIFVCGLLAVGVTFSASSQSRAEFAFVNSTEPRSLDPARMTGQPEHRISEAIFEGLARLDARTLIPVPGMAESWEISADGKRYLFRLRKSARWSDGRPVTAHDFTYAWRRLQEPAMGAEYAYILHAVRYAEAFNTYEARAKSLEGPIASALSELARKHPEAIPALAVRSFASEQHLHGALKDTSDAYLAAFLVRRDAPLSTADVPRLARALAEEAKRLRSAHAEAVIRFGRDGGVSAIDDHTLSVELVAPTPYFLELTTFYPTFPVPRWAVESKPDTWFLPENLVSNGPFRLALWRVGDRVRLERSSSYWGRERVKIQTIDALPIENTTTALNLYLTGQVDWLPTNSYPQDLTDEIRKRPDFYKGPALIVYYYRINCTRRPFTDARVRKALNLAIDRGTIVRDVLGLGQIPAAQFVPPGIAGYEPPASEIRLDLARARALLAEAGFPDGKGFPKFGILYNTMEAHKKIAEVIADQLRRGLGLDVTAYNQEWQAYQATTMMLDYDIARAGWIGDYEDPNTFLNLWVTNGGNNQTGWGHPTYDRLIAAAADSERVLRDPSELLPLLREPERVKAITDEAVSATAPEARLALLNRLRMALFREAESMLVNEQLPIIPIYFYVNNGLVRPHVKGFYKEIEAVDGRKRPNLRELHPLSAIYIDESRSGDGD